MPTASESRLALTLVTGAAVQAATRLLSSLSGSPESQRSDLLDTVPALIGYYADGSSALAADFYDDEVETMLQGLTSLLEPLLMVFLGVVIGGIVLCMFLPIFKMGEVVSGG